MFEVKNLKHDEDFCVLEFCVHLEKRVFVLLCPSLATMATSDLKFLIERLFIRVNLKHQVFMVLR